MKTSLFTMSSLLILLNLSIPTTGLFAEGEWKSAVETFGRNENLHPYSLTITSHTYGGSGELEKTEVQSFSLDYSNGFEEPERRLLRATEDGRDVTEKVRKQLEKAVSNRGNAPGEEMDGMQKHPLDISIQEDVYAFNTGKKEYRNGRLCTLWSFEIQLNDKYRGIGTAWIDSASSAAVRIEYRIDPLFPFVDRMGISMEYSGDPDEAWVMNKLTMSGTVNMIITRKSFESVLRFSDYR